MAYKANVRVEAKRLPLNASRSERDRSITTLLRIFKRACNDAGIMHAFKEKEYHQRPTDLRRRKRLARVRATNEGVELALNPSKKKEVKGSNNGFSY